MHKNQFVENLAKRLECSATQAEVYFNAVIKEIKELLMNGDKLTIPGFGKFAVTTRAGRMGRNPKTGQPLQIDAKATLVFKPGDALKLHVANAVVVSAKK